MSLCMEIELYSKHGSQEAEFGKLAHTAVNGPYDVERMLCWILRRTDVTSHTIHRAMHIFWKLNCIQNMEVKKQNSGS
jgi:hypothetical protein